MILALSTTASAYAQTYDVWQALAMHWDLRQSILQMHAASSDPVPLLMVGDSLAEGFVWNEVAGCRLINSGMAGIWSKPLSERIATILSSTRPSAVILLVGTNDADIRKTVSIEEFKSNYAQIVDTILSSGAEVLITVPPPMEEEVGVAAMYSPNKLRHIVAAVGEIAQSRQLPVLNSADLMSTPDGTARPGSTSDGIHLSGATYKSLKAALDMSVERLELDC